MKYPISPEYMDSAPVPLIRLFNALEQKILTDICERFKGTGEATETAIQLIKQLQRQGNDLQTIEGYIKQTLNLSDAEYDKIINNAVLRNQAYFDDAITKADILADTYRQAALVDNINAIKGQTKAEFVNLTQSLGFAVRNAGGQIEFLPVAQVYQRILDDAAIQAYTGAFSPNEVVRTAVKRLTDSGLQVVNYETGWHNRIEVAARRAIMTGITQISRQYSDNLGAEFNTPYVEVTAHVGARDKAGDTPWASHKAWQGKVYSKNTGDKYPNVYAVCGLGEVDGLTGANCRHMYYPFVDGVMERTYTDEELENIDPKPFEYQGKIYTAYEATQFQRKMKPN